MVANEIVKQSTRGGWVSFSSASLDITSARGLIILALWNMSLTAQLVISLEEQIQNLTVCSPFQHHYNIYLRWSYLLVGDHKGARLSELRWKVIHHFWSSSSKDAL